MKTLSALLLAFALMVAVLAHADEPASTPSTQPTSAPTAASSPSKSLPELERMTKLCDLTPEQSKKYKDNEEARKAAEKDVRAAIDAGAKGLNDPNPYKAAAAKEEQARLNRQLQRLEKQFDDAKMAILTDEQRSKWQENADEQRLADGAKRLDAMVKLGGMDLSQEQVKSVAAVFDAATRTYADSRVKRTDLEDAIYAARKQHDDEKVADLKTQLEQLDAQARAIWSKGTSDSFAMLTQDQKMAMFDKIAPRGLKQLGPIELTDEQKAHLRKSFADLVEKKGVSMENLNATLQEQLLGTILTKEQKTKWLLDKILRDVPGGFVALGKGKHNITLTDDQKAKVKEAFEALLNSPQGPDLSAIKSADDVKNIVQTTVTKLCAQLAGFLNSDQKAELDRAKKLDEEQQAATRPSA